MKTAIVVQVRRGMSAKRRQRRRRNQHRRQRDLKEWTQKIKSEKVEWIFPVNLVLNILT